MVKVSTASRRCSARILAVCILWIWGAACTPVGDTSSIAQPARYFSLENYFRQEASRLQRLAPRVAKTVSKNGAPESKEISIANWEREFALFIEADINKPAWRNSYRIDSTANTVQYTSSDPALRTTRITIAKHTDGTISHIGITNSIGNMLYQTDEQLDYYPDSLYRIIKQQHVRVIGNSHYVVTGRLK